MHSLCDSIQELPDRRLTEVEESGHQAGVHTVQVVANSKHGESQQTKLPSGRLPRCSYEAEKVTLNFYLDKSI